MYRHLNTLWKHFAVSRRASAIVQVCVCIQYVSMHVMPYLMIFPLGFPC